MVTHCWIPVFPTIPITMPSLSFTTRKVRKQVAELCRYKSAGSDGLHRAILKPLAEILAAHLAPLFEKSLIDKHLVSHWKTAIVTPIHKGGRNDFVSN